MLSIIGTLDQLVQNATADLPSVETGDAATINGARSSKLPVSLGLDVMGGIIQAMGGNLGVKASYENAKKVQFAYSGVSLLRANIIKIGDYLQSGDVLWDHLILKKYLFGKGKLYVLTEVATSNEFGVEAFRSDNTSIDVSVPTIAQAVGGKVSVGYDGQSTSAVKYKGDKQLAFGFAAVEFSAIHNDQDDLALNFEPVKAGDASFGLSDQDPVVAYLREHGPLDTLKHADAAALGDS